VQRKNVFGVIPLGVSEAHPGCHGYPGCCVWCEVGTEAEETGEYLSKMSCLPRTTLYLSVVACFDRLLQSVNRFGLQTHI
jgi:hypothetical protein